jgi:hypothetical protein
MQQQLKLAGATPLWRFVLMMLKAEWMLKPISMPAQP